MAGSNHLYKLIGTATLVEKSCLGADRVSRKNILLNFATALILVMLSSTSVYAGDTPNEISERISIGNPATGKEKSTLCQGCHGEYGISTQPNIPNLAGQWGPYIMRQLRDFWMGSRSDQIMTDMAGTITSTEDAFDIAAYFASQNQMTGTPLQNESGKRLFVIYRCISCHGEEGKGRPQNNPLFPVIGGQRKEYLMKQFDDFKNGLRDSDMSGTMPALAKHMSTAELETIADYLSGL